KPNPERFDPRDALGAGVQKPDYARIRVPALALYAAPETWKEMVPGAQEFSDPEKRAAAERVVAYTALTRKLMEDTFRSGVADSTSAGGNLEYDFARRVPAGSVLERLTCAGERKYFGDDRLELSFIHEHRDLIQLPAISIDNEKDSTGAVLLSDTGRNRRNYA